MAGAVMSIHTEFGSRGRASSPDRRAGRPRAAAAASPRPEARLSLWRRAVRAAQALDDHWLGDALGVLMLFVIIYGLWLFAAVLG